jgi:hypothetical protein
MQPNGLLAPGVRPFQDVGTEGQGVLPYTTGGTFYLDLGICCAANSWTLKVGPFVGPQS